MDVDSRSANPLTGGGAVNGPSANQNSNGALGADFQTFLTMLTVQMQNQDPLNPLAASDFAVQLATFSGVEQQVQTNRLLSVMASQTAVANMSQLAGWIGQEARVSADVWYSGQPVTLSPNPRIDADHSVLIVRDSAGNLVSREDVPVSAEAWTWLGTDAKGDALAEGRYQLTLESVRNGEVLSEDPVEYYARIIEARGGVDGARLVLEGGIEVAAGAISALRRSAN